MGALLESLLIASALMLVIEGITPFLSPSVFRKALIQMATMKDQHLRSIGFFSMFFGLILLYWVH